MIFEFKSVQKAKNYYTHCIYKYVTIYICTHIYKMNAIKTYICFFKYFVLAFVENQVMERQQSER